MREVLKSFLSFSWGLSLFGMRQALNLASPERAAAAFDTVARAAAERMGEPLGKVFQEGDRLQRQVIDSVFGAAAGPGSPPAGEQTTETEEVDSPDQAVDAGRLDPSSLVVL